MLQKMRNFSLHFPVNFCGVKGTHLKMILFSHENIHEKKEKKNKKNCNSVLLELTKSRNINMKAGRNIFAVVFR